MAIFTNFATLSYNGGSTNSNTVTGQLLEVLAADKTAVVDTYNPGDRVTYVVTLRNSGPTALTGLTLTDDLGGYTLDAATVYPLAYTADSTHLYVNGVEQPAPTVTPGPPMTITGLSVPAGSNAILVYEAAVTEAAPPVVEGTIVNTVTVTGGGLSAPLTATETITAVAQARLTISKSLSPSTVTENGQITYTFVIENTGNSPAVAADNVAVADTFLPVLQGLSATLDGVTLTEGTDYTYDETTGVFATVPGRITIDAASFAQNADGTYTITPGVSVLTVTGTI